MKMFSGIFLVSLFLTSCSTNSVAEFDYNKNCTPRAKERMEKYQAPAAATEQLEKESIAKIKKISVPIAKMAADKCYYDPQFDYKDAYNVCPLISLDAKGKVIFIDVEDNANKLPPELQKCLQNIFNQGDYSTLPSKTFGQPLTLTPVQRTY